MKVLLIVAAVAFALGVTYSMTKPHGFPGVSLFDSQCRVKLVNGVFGC